LNDTYIFSFDTNTWERLQTEPRPPPCRGATFVQLSHNEAILHGGSHGRAEPPFSQIFIFSLSENSWREVTAKNPLALYRHTSVVRFPKPGRPELVVFGGIGEDHLLSNKLSSFDLDSEEWSSALNLTSAEPLPRESPASFLYDHCLIIYGGSTPLASSADAWEFNFQTNLWLCLRSNERAAEEAREDKWPAARCYHSSASSRDTMYILGGRAGLSYFGDVRAFQVRPM
jgi:hypothetical protein